MYEDGGGKASHFREKADRQPTAASEIVCVKITESTPQRSFTLEVSERELRYLQKLTSDSKLSNDIRLGLTSDEAYKLTVALRSHVEDMDTTEG